MNFDNLKNESNKLVQFANESTQRVGEIYNENKPYINNAGSGLWNVFRYILGGIFAFMSLSCLIGVFVVFGFMGADSDFPPVSEMNFYFDNDSMKYIIMALITLGSLIPAIFGLLSIKLISPKTKLRNTGWVIGALFLALISLGTYFGISMARKMFLKGHKEDTEEVAINKIRQYLCRCKAGKYSSKLQGYDDDLYSDKISVLKKTGSMWM
jgi:hypothetical protein